MGRPRRRWPLRRRIQYSGRSSISPPPPLLTQSLYGSTLFNYQVSKRRNSARPTARDPRVTTLSRPGGMNEPGHRVKGVECVSRSSMRGWCSSPTPPIVQERATRLLHYSFNGRLHTVSAIHRSTQNVPTRLSLQPAHLHTPAAQKREHELTLLLFITSPTIITAARCYFYWL
jgi:hypothetical protein